MKGERERVKKPAAVRGGMMAEVPVVPAGT